MYLISACLCGIPCRMDGKAKPVPALVDLAARGEAIPVCPEVLGGLPTPRAPSERQPDGRVVNSMGKDVSVRFHRGAVRALEICLQQRCACAILKARSPSCGKGEIYDGTFTKTLVPGNGVCAELLLAHGIPVLTEEEYLKRMEEKP